MFRNNNSSSLLKFQQKQSINQMARNITSCDELKQGYFIESPLLTQSRYSCCVVIYLRTSLVALTLTSKKLPNLYKSCPKMISLEKLKILAPLQKVP